MHAQVARFIFKYKCMCITVHMHSYIAIYAIVWLQLMQRCIENLLYHTDAGTYIITSQNTMYCGGEPEASYTKRHIATAYIF